MLLFLLFTLLLSPSHGALEGGADTMDLIKRLQKMETNMLKIKEDLEDRMARFEVEDPELEDRVAKLEDLAKIGTLRSCHEYSQYGPKTSGPYLIDPDGGLQTLTPSRLRNVVREKNGIMWEFFQHNPVFF